MKASALCSSPKIAPLLSGTDDSAPVSSALPWAGQAGPARLLIVNGHKNSISPFITPREFEVLKLLADGRTPRQIARALGVSFKTVSCHRNRILAKRKVHDTLVVRGPADGHEPSYLNQLLAVHING